MAGREIRPRRGDPLGIQTRNRRHYPANDEAELAQFWTAAVLCSFSSDGLRTEEHGGSKDPPTTGRSLGIETRSRATRFWGNAAECPHPLRAKNEPKNRL